MVDFDSIAAQKNRYDKEAEAYDRHHGDNLNQLYRDKFIRERLFDFDMSGRVVLDAMCASGIETGFLLSRGANVVGLDVSDENIRIYKEKWSCLSRVASVHETEFDDASFDGVYIFGGLHHVLPIIDVVMAEVFRILKPGGFFIFVEPNRDSVFDLARRVWYRLDKRFQSDEQAISYRTLKDKYLAIGFSEDKVIYGGGVAYLLIAQSLIMGVPAGLKALIYKPLFWLERLLGGAGGGKFFAARWIKK